MCVCVLGEAEGGGFVYEGDDVCACGVCICMLRVRVCICVYLSEGNWDRPKWVMKYNNIYSFLSCGVSVALGRVVDN